MQPVADGLVSRFARAFCYGRAGYSLQQLEDLLPRYGANVPDIETGVSTSKVPYFRACVTSMAPMQQRQFLYDLCDSPPPAKYALPSEEHRLELLRQLSEADGASPVGVELSRTSLRAAREAWFTAASRVPGSPAAAVTAARTLLESTCKTILDERGQSVARGANLETIVKQTRQELGINAPGSAERATKTLVSGLSGCVSGLAALSNLAGDRHGLVGGEKIEDHVLAGLAVNAAGTLAVFLVQTHRFEARSS